VDRWYGVVAHVATGAMLLYLLLRVDQWLRKSDTTSVADRHGARVVGEVCGKSGRDLREVTIC